VRSDESSRACSEASSVRRSGIEVAGMLAEFSLVPELTQRVGLDVSY
jgi:hypothetical protein